MNQIFDYITSLDWANNWAIYLFTSALILWFGILTIKLILNKLVYVVKKAFIISLMLIVLSLISYMLFLMGFIDFDILSLVGFNEISLNIQEFINNLHEWFKNTFSLSATFIKFLA